MPSTLTTSLSIERDVPVTMRDGTALAADVWRSAGAEAPGPVLLQRTAYDKGDLLNAAHHAGLDPLRAVGAGWTVVISDVRGRFASAGDFTPFSCEAADGADTIAWLREQPFCDGRVATYGTSYNGAVQLLAAEREPEGLVALSAVESASPRHDGLTRVGGAVALGFLASWVVNDLAPAQLARLSADEDRTAALAADLDALRRDPRAALARLDSGDLGALGALVPALRGWLASEDGGAGGRAGYGALPVPSLHVGGWYDLFAGATIDTYMNAGPAARLVIGPWAHGVTGSRVGEVDFGPDAAQAAFDLTAIQLAFFAAVLEDRLDAIPPVRVFVMGADAWREEGAWPPARMRPVTLHLQAGGGLGAAACADAEASWSIAHDPADPVPTRGGAIVVAPALGVPGPADQRSIEERSDVLSFTSAPLDADLELMGSVRADLRVATNAPVADWSVRLTAVAPGGASMLIADGLARVRARDGVSAVRVCVGSTAIVIPARHRLRVAIAASNVPRADVQRCPARQRVLAGSTITLPVTSGALQ